MQAGVTPNVLTEILNVFTQMGTWIGTAVNDLMPMFYTAENGLSFLGILAVASLAFSVVFLLISFIQRFLNFGG